MLLVTGSWPRDLKKHELRLSLIVRHGNGVGCLHWRWYGKGTICCISVLNVHCTHELWAQIRIDRRIQIIRSLFVLLLRRCLYNL